MTKTQMADLQPKKKGTVKKRKVAMTPPPKPKAKPKKAIDRMRRKRLYSTKSPSMGKR